MRKKAVCVLISGGLDSDILLAEMAQEYQKVWPLYIRQGLAWEDVELYWLKRYLKTLSVQPLHILELPMTDLYGAHWSTGRRPAPGARTRDESVYLPGRNLILSVKAAVFAAMKKISVLALGSLAHNPFPDASLSFFKRWGAALGMGLASPMRVIAPYRCLSKRQVILRGRDLRLDLSFSCIAPRGKLHCGRCNKCAERRRAFKAAGVSDLTTYAKA